MTKPARYINSELNSVHRSSEGRISVALAYPDAYEVGLSNLGLQILYELVNKRDDAVAERVYAPWVDMEAEMRRAGIPLFSLESHRPVASFDLLGFTLQYELTYTNILNMLDLAGIPIFSSERGEGDPLIVGGGPGAFSPEPIAPFFDLFAIGDGELLLPDLIEAVGRAKSEGTSRQELLKELSTIPGLYVPSLYEPEYAEDGALKAIQPVDGAPSVVARRILKDLEDAPLLARPIVPLMDSVHDRCVVEVMRGCTRGCRFCQAGIIYRPVRERGQATIVENAEEVVAATGFEEVSFSSLSTADHSAIKEVLTELAGKYGRDVSLSLPSLRADSFSVDLVHQIAKSKRTGLTFAPEAGTQRLRDVINKGVTEENLLEAAAKAFESGWQRLKLYFMIGLPTETTADLDGIVDLTYRVSDLGRSILPPKQRGRLSVTASVSTFVPKAHTPFQWWPQDTLEEIERKQDYLKSTLRGRTVSLRWHESRVSALEGVLARGDRRVAQVIYEAWRSGATFDAWSDEYDFGAWVEAFERSGVSMAAYANRPREFSEVLPWSHIDSGVTVDFLQAECERAFDGITTADCRSGGCSLCGVCSRFKVKNIYARRVKNAETVAQVR